MSITSAELENLMNYATGTEGYTKYTFFGKSILLTDGAILFANKAEAYWFIEEIMLYRSKLLSKSPNEYLFSISLIAKNNKARIIFKDAEKKVLEKRISFTDCPEGTWNFYYDVESNVLMYKSEY